MPKVERAVGMFCDTKLTEWDIDLPKLADGAGMFSGCSKLTSFSGDLSSLTDGGGMFQNSALTSFYNDLPSLTDAEYMFTGCTSLTSFQGDLSSLEDGARMFYQCPRLTSFEGDLSYLTSAFYMFTSCYALSSFRSDFQNICDGDYMFHYCTRLSDLQCDFSYLCCAEHAFCYNRLSASSVTSLYESISSAYTYRYSSLSYPYLSIGVGYRDANDFASALSSIGFSSTNSINQLTGWFNNKGWYVSYEYNDAVDRYAYCTTPDAVYEDNDNFAGGIKFGIWSQSLESLTTSKFSNSSYQISLFYPGLFSEV